MKIRKYNKDDLRQVVQLFFHTVHTSNAKYYSAEQLAVWAPKNPDLEKWQSSLMKNDCLVAVMDNQIIGFGDMDKTGYLDRLYVSPSYQRMGVASQICDLLEERVKRPITTHVSITAKPFLKKEAIRLLKCNRLSVKEYS
ncbi:GNAT family N-acetyltransferase [Enterococcus cecorum]